jgi:hypothetical protein
MAYTLTNVTDDIRNYTEVDSGVLTTGVVNTFVKNAENRIYREVDSDDNRHYATSNLAVGNRYVTIPSDLRSIRYVQLKNTTVTPNTQTFLEKKIHPIWQLFMIHLAQQMAFQNTTLIGMLIFG